MSNMSYCRFENTDNDLSDCEDVLLSHSSAITGEYEIPAAANLVRRCIAIYAYFAEEMQLSDNNCDVESIEKYIRENYKKGTEDE